MIESLCTCGQPISLPESACATTYYCPACKGAIHLVCAEKLTNGAGTGDFDARLVVEKGPHGDRVGHVYLLGGISQITLGKLSTSHVLLPGSNVSRVHATLKRLDFGPSRWQIEDCHSANGLWINDSRCTEPYELQDNDLIVIGDYEFRFQHAAAPTPVATATVVGKSPTGAIRPVVATQPCPSCGRSLATTAKICVDCGIDVSTGRPLITSRGFDENEFALRSSLWIRVVSWFVPIGIYPVASEAMGTRRPIAVWSIAVLTILVSMWFFVARNSDSDVKNLMLWSGNPAAGTRVAKAIDREVKKYGDSMSQREREAVDRLKAKLEKQEREGAGEFHSYQFLTHALLHGGLMHLAGNLLFMFVLGSRVNALIGNVKAAIIYPILAVTAGVIHHVAMSREPYGAALGASGAIMGLAGMYLVLFPRNKVHMATWFRLGPFLLAFPLSLILFFRLFLFRVFKVFTVPGLFVVLFYIAFDLWNIYRGDDDGVAHWAHLGGFLAGITIALFLLVTRLVDARGGDILSATLGRHAWTLVGKPSARKPDAGPSVLKPTVPVTSLNFPE